MCNDSQGFHSLVGGYYSLKRKCDSKVAEQFINIAAPAAVVERTALHQCFHKANHQSGSSFCTSDPKTSDHTRQKRRVKALWKTCK